MDATVEVEDEPGAILNGGHRDPLQPNKTIHIAAFIAVLAAIVFTLFKKWRTREFASRDNATRVEVELTEDAIKRREAIEAVRTRMQERFNQDAERFKQMMAEEEERRAQRRAEVLEAMSCGRSCKLDNQASSASLK